MCEPITDSLAVAVAVATRTRLQSFSQTLSSHSISFSRSPLSLLLAVDALCPDDAPSSISLLSSAHLSSQRLFLCPFPVAIRVRLPVLGLGSTRTCVQPRDRQSASAAQSADMSPWNMKVGLNVRERERSGTARDERKLIFISSLSSPLLPSSTLLPLLSFDPRLCLLCIRDARLSFIVSSSHRLSLSPALRWLHALPFCSLFPCMPCIALPFLCKLIPRRCWRLLHPIFLLILPLIPFSHFLHLHGNTTHSHTHTLLTLMTRMHCLS